MLFLKRFATLTLSLGLIASTAAVILWAQTDRGTITGTVTDPSGAVIVGATVTATHVGTHVSTKVAATSSGKYTIPLLPVGIYDVTVEQSGFKKYVRTGVTVEVAQTVRVDAAMQIGESSQAVEVSAQAVQIQTDTSDRGTLITGQEVLDLPLVTQSEQRNPALFITLAPGVNSRGTVASTPSGSGRQLDTTVNGSQSGSIEWHLDGAVLGQGYVMSGDFRQLPFPPDAVGEFKIMTLLPPAEFGQTGLGITNFSLKSGTNAIHGTVYEYFRNTALDARGFYAAATPKNNQNEFGFTTGGPIHKDKTFFYGWYHGFRLARQPGANQKDTLPTAAMKGGDLSNILGPQLGNDALGRPVYSTEIYDPATTRPVLAGATDTATGLVNNSGADAIIRDGFGFNPVTGSPIPGQANIIPSNRIDPVAKKMFSYFADPPACSACPYGYQLNWIGNFLSSNTVNDWGAKIDQVFSDRNRISGEFIWAKNFAPTGSKWPGAISEGSISTLGSRILRLSHDFFVRPNLVNHWTFGFNRQRNDSFPEAGVGWPAVLGYTGVPGTGAGSTFPELIIGGLGNTYARGGQGFSANNNFSFDENVTWIKSKHTFKMGFSYLKIQSNALNSTFQSSSTTYNAGTTGLPDPKFFNDGNGPGGSYTGVGVAGFLLGLPSSGRAGITAAEGADRMGRYGAYVQDDYKMSSKLTFNMGLRWDLFRPTVDAHNQRSWMDPTIINTDLGIPGVLAFATDSRRAAQDAYTKAFGPRFGFAYALTDKTVLRGGYGILYTAGGGQRANPGSFEQQGFSAINPCNESNSLGFVGALSCSPPGNADVHMTLATGWPAQYYVNPPFINQNFSNGQGPASLGAFPGDSIPPDIQNGFISLQRELPGQILLDVGYVWTKGTHLGSRLMHSNATPTVYQSFGADLFKNIADPGIQALPIVQAMPTDPGTGFHSPFKGFESLWGGSATLGQALRPFPQYTIDTLQQLAQLRDFGETQGMSTYNALQISARKRLNHGLAFLVSYTWSKTLTNAENLFNEFSGFTQDYYNQAAEKALSLNDYPSNLVFSYQYELPFGPGRKWAKGGPASKVIGGWSIAGIQQYRSGAPQMISSYANSLNPYMGANGFMIRPNVVPGVNHKSDAILNGTWDPNGLNEAGSLFNLKAWTDPAKYAFGNGPRTDGTIRQLPFYNEDLSIIKRTTISERVSVEFRADFLNIFNRTLFGFDQGGDQYGSLLGGGNIGNGPASFGHVSGQTNPPREIQFGLKINY